MFQTYGSLATDSLMLLFTQHKATWLTTIGSHCLATLPANVARCLRSTVTCGKTSATVTVAEVKVWRFCRVFYAVKTNSRTIRSQVSQPASAGKGADMSELQAHHCITPEQWTWLLCSVSVIYRNINCRCRHYINQSELCCWLLVSSIIWSADFWSAA